MSHRVWTGWLAVAGFGAVGCVGAASAEEAARAVAQIAVTPPDVRCIRVEVRYTDGSTLAAEGAVSPGAASRIDLGVLSPGAATVSGLAWNDGCPKGVAPTPSWVSDALPVTLTRGSFQDIALVFRPNSRTSLTADFRVPVRALAAGMATTFALMADGSVRAWGFNDAGQTGVRGAPGRVLRPTQVSDLRRVRALAGGAVHACAIDDAADVYCWGANSLGELGVPGHSGPAAVLVPGLRGATQLAAGSAHTCALVDRNGDNVAVWCWGANHAGQHGTGDTAPSPTPRLSTLGPFTQLRAFRDTTCTLDAVGRVFCAGRGDNRSFGLAAAGPFSSWMETAFPFAETHAPGDRRACSVNPAGQVLCAGLGVTVDASGRALFADTGFAPRPIGGLTGVTQLVAGTEFTCALRGDGTVWCFGPARLAVTADPTMRVGDLVPRAVPGITGVTQLVAGASHACALRSDGSVWCWGDNQQGQLGDGTIMTRFRPVQVAF